ncbi:hypothetical protein GEMRC1_003606 [Eukaryota sp. GEM-RC1]
MLLYCFAVSRLFLCGITGKPGTTDSKQTKIIHNTALGAEQVIPWEYCTTTVDGINSAINQGYTPVAIETDPDAVALHKFIWPARPCIVMGNEVTGVGRSALSLCSHKVYVPMMGMKKSMNVATCFSLVAYECSMSLLNQEHGSIDAGLDVMTNSPLSL